MTDIFSSLLAAPHWVFISLGGVLLIVELLGTGGYSLWSGISAVLVGVIAWLFPAFSWIVLWILFAVFTLITAYVWWLWMKKHGDKSVKNQLNQPRNELIGVKTVVVSAIINGSGRVKIKDGSWSATSSHDLSLGTKVIVTDVDGLILTVEKIEQ